MSTSFLNLDQTELKSARSAPSSGTAFDKAEAASAPTDRPATSQSYAQDGGDFEIVFGRRQIASTSLVLVVGLVCFAGVSYLIGRSAGSKSAPGAAEAPQLPAVASQPVPTPQPVAVKTSAGPAPSAAAASPAANKDQSPIFGEAVSGQVYIQAGAIDKGLAGIWAEGLRVHGLKAFVSAGPSDKVWRVLIGPLPDPQAYQQAKNTLVQLGVDTFGRRYPDPPATRQPAASVNAPVSAPGN